MALPATDEDVQPLIKTVDTEILKRRLVAKKRLSANCDQEGIKDQTSPKSWKDSVSTFYKNITENLDRATTRNLIYYLKISYSRKADAACKSTWTLWALQNAQKLVEDLWTENQL